MVPSLTAALNLQICFEINETTINVASHTHTAHFPIAPEELFHIFSLPQDTLYHLKNNTKKQK
jgi:hypothetical protein